jgi:hypothetical protein
MFVNLATLPFVLLYGQLTFLHVRYQHLSSLHGDQIAEFSPVGRLFSFGQFYEKIFSASKVLH